MLPWPGPVMETSQRMTNHQSTPLSLGCTLQNAAELLSLTNSLHQKHIWNLDVVRYSDCRDPANTHEVYLKRQTDWFALFAYLGPQRWEEILSVRCDLLEDRIVPCVAFASLVLQGLKIPFWFLTENVKTRDQIFATAVLWKMRLCSYELCGIIWAFFDIYWVERFKYGAIMNKYLNYDISRMRNRFFKTALGNLPRNFCDFLPLGGLGLIPPIVLFK